MNKPSFLINHRNKNGSLFPSIPDTKKRNIERSIKHAVFDVDNKLTKLDDEITLESKSIKQLEPTNQIKSLFKTPKPKCSHKKIPIHFQSDTNLYHKEQDKDDLPIITLPSKRKIYLSPLQSDSHHKGKHHKIKSLMIQLNHENNMNHDLSFIMKNNSDIYSSPKIENNQSNCIKKRLINQFRIIDYETNQFNSEVKIQKKTGESINQRMKEKYDNLYWKYIFSSNEKDLMMSKEYKLMLEMNTGKKNETLTAKLDNVIEKLKGKDSIAFSEILNKMQNEKQLPVYIRRQKHKKEQQGREYALDLLDKANLQSLKIKGSSIPQDDI